MDFHWSLLRDWGNLSSWKLLRAGPTLGLGPNPLPMASSAQVLRFSKSQESNAVSGTFTWLNHGFPHLIPIAITWPILDGESMHHLKKSVVRRRLTQMIKCVGLIFLNRNSSMLCIWMKIIASIYWASCCAKRWTINHVPSLWTLRKHP